MEFPNSSNTTTAPYLNVRESLECANDQAISEDASLPSSEELKYRAYGVYAAQGRAVTRNDYEAYCYQMPPSLGGVKRANIVNDPGGTNRRLALYVASEDADGYLMNTKAVVKNNLKFIGHNKLSPDLLCSSVMGCDFSIRLATLLALAGACLNVTTCFTGYLVTVGQFCNRQRIIICTIVGQNDSKIRIGHERAATFTVR